MSKSLGNRYEHPPCMWNIIQSIRNSKNPSHNERFALVSYLLKCGYSEEECCELFETVHDYDENITSYQVGTIKRGDYTPPNCLTMQDDGICPVVEGLERDVLCEQDWLNSPFWYNKCRTEDK